jgi:triacylglycerol lipase
MQAGGQMAQNTIVLAHGILGFGELFGIPLPAEYFNGVANHLTVNGYNVIVPQVKTIGNVAARGDELREAILKAPAADEVHVIAHSMGGLDARHALATSSAVAKRVKTLVTIGTPHQGSPVADAIVDGTGPLFEKFSELPLVLRKFIDANAGGLKDLTTEAAKHFNKATPDVPGVRYIEVAGDASQGGNELFLFQLAAAIGELHGVNDGVVTKVSALRVAHEHLPDWPVDHAGEVGWTAKSLLQLPFGTGLQPHLARYDAIVGLL